MAIKNITTPDFGNVEDVTVIEVLVKPGDEIKKDTPIVTLESDKATMEIPSTDAGVVKEVKVKVGDKVSNGSVLVSVEAKGEEKDAAKKEEKKSASAEQPKKEEKEPAQPESAKETKEEREEEPEEEREDEDEEEHEEKHKKEPEKKSEEKRSSSQPESTGTRDVHAGPGVRQLARELGVNLAVVSGSGPKQRILKEDVNAYVKGQLSQLQSGGLALGAAPAIDFSKFGSVETQALSRIKKLSGKNLQRNWMTIPHVTQFGEADITEMENFRVAQKAELDKQNIKLTPLVFIMKAVVATLKAFPQFNSSLDSTSENLIMKKYIHLGVAVDTPDGLVVPVIRDVDKKGMIDLAKELTHVSERARKKQLLPADMQGGCFSISSLGGIGGTAFTPIINAPEVAILGVSKSQYKPVYQDGKFEPRLMLPLALSYDHRVVDGAEGARFIVYMTNMLADIRNLLM